MVYPESGSADEPDSLADPLHHAFSAPLPIVNTFEYLLFPGVFRPSLFAAYFSLTTSTFYYLPFLTLRLPEYRLLFTVYYLLLTF